MKTNPLRVFAAACIVAVGIGLLIFIAKQNNAAQRDFIVYWAAGQQLVHGGNPYDEAAALKLERAVGYRRATAQAWLSPPVAFFLALPLGFVSANLASILWMLALLACLVASIRIIWAMNGRPPTRLHLLGYCFAPVMECLMAGQLGIFLLLAVVLFLYFHKSRPLLAGTLLLPCALKPHLFLPLAIVLLLWSFHRRTYRVLAAFLVTLLASCALTLCFDVHVWSQYFRMMAATEVMQDYVPTLSATLRFLVDRNAVWIQLIPEAAACLWAIWCFWTRRDRWDWMDRGLLVLLVSVVCTPHAWFTDESVVLPAVLAGVYRAADSGRSLVPFGIVAGVAMIEVMLAIPITSGYYLWTPLAWLAWYLYATRSKSAPAGELRDEAVGLSD